MASPASVSAAAQTLRVELDGRSYPIEIGLQLPETWGADWPPPPASRVLLVSDETVAGLYAPKLAAALERHGATVALATVPPGENSKSLAQAAQLYSEAVRARLDRSGTVLALGGGVVGDLAGFVAATYLRGVRLVQVPTSLLAMVDSSVGGKTAVNLPEGKNLVGAFHQPAAVRIALATLDTLPYREFASGMAEVIKYGAIRDTALLDLLETHAARLGCPDADPDVLREIVARCCRIKADIVAADEREAGERALLNFGHTIGHALEKTLGFGVWLHGEAVAFGMVYAARLAEATGLCREPWSERLKALCGRFGLPVDHARLARSAGGSAPSWEEIRSVMTADKKTRAGRPRFVLCERPGTARFDCEVPEEALRAAWEAMRGDA